MAQYGKIELHFEDCLTVMENMIDENIKVDAIITDPPYLINYKTNRRKDKDDDFCSTIVNDDCFDFKRWSMLTDGILFDNSPLYIFGCWKTEPYFRDIFSQFWNHKNNIVMVKKNWTAGDLQAQYGQQYELIFLYNKGRSLIRGRRFSDVWFADSVSGENQIHQNQKPVSLVERIVESCTDEGQTVFDGFLGSGTTGVACKNLNRNFIGCELDDEYFKIAEKRISEAKYQPSLFD